MPRKKMKDILIIWLVVTIALGVFGWKGILAGIMGGAMIILPMIFGK